MRFAKRRRRESATKTAVFRRLSWFFQDRSASLILISLFVVAAFLTGGSARPDVASLIILRPLSALMLGYALWFLTRQEATRHSIPFAFAVAVVALAVVHVVPLPPQFFAGSIGHQLAQDIDASVGLVGLWRSFALSPEHAWNALFSLLTPLAVLVACARLTDEGLRSLAALLLAVCLASAILAAAQISVGGGSGLYFYRITNNGDAVGLFANRNHQAILLACSFPLLAFFAARRGHSKRTDRRRLIFAFGSALFILPLLLVTGSRAGAAAGLLGLLSSAFVYRAASHPAKPTPSRKNASRIAVIGSALIAIVVIAATIVTGRAQALLRILETDRDQELRFQYWEVVATNLSSFMPFGTGNGSYERVFQLLEPDALLRPSYSNHAHNDWLEVVMTTGIPGGILLVVALIFFLASIASVVKQWRPGCRGQGLSVAGLSIVGILALGSVFDYPLRTPALLSLFVIACVWVTRGTTGAASADRAFANNEHGRRSSTP